MTRPRRLRSDAVHPVETYLREINDRPALPSRKGPRLSIETGDAEARDQMVRANLRLVVNIAAATPAGLGLQDLIEEATRLLRAVEGSTPP